MGVRLKNKKKDKEGNEIGESIHYALAQRKGKSRYPIKTLYSQSIPQMVGDEKRVYNIVSPEIEELLYKNINAGIAAAKQIVDFIQNGNTRFQVNK